MSAVSTLTNQEKNSRLQHDFYNSILGSILLGYFFQKLKSAHTFPKVNRFLIINQL